MNYNLKVDLIKVTHLYFLRTEWWQTKNFPLTLYKVLFVEISSRKLHIVSSEFCIDSFQRFYNIEHTFSPVSLRTTTIWPLSISRGPNSTRSGTPYEQEIERRRRLTLAVISHKYWCNSSVIFFWRKFKLI